MHPALFLQRVLRTVRNRERFLRAVRRAILPNCGLRQHLIFPLFNPDLGKIAAIRALLHAFRAIGGKQHHHDLLCGIARRAV